MEPLTASSLSVKLAGIETGLQQFILEQKSRMLAIEQRVTAPGGGAYGGGDLNDIGRTVAESEEFKAFATGNGKTSGRITVPGFHTKTVIVNATGLNQPLVQAFRRPGVIAPGQQRLTVRDLLPSLPINSNMVEYCRESSFVSDAAMQTAEGAAKGESELDFTLSYAPVQTLAHWIPASRQVMEDSSALAGYINARLLYLLKLKEEDELLNGSGTGTNLSGLVTNATAYDTSYTVAATDTFIDVIGHAIAQVEQNSDFEADAIIMHPLDWHTITQIKTSGTGITQGEYVFSNPQQAQTPMLWGKAVIPTKSMARSQFLVGAFGLAAAIWDRDQATVEISREHSDFFIKNLLAILVEERLALTVFRSDALVYGGFPFGS
jgi:HK97 family phage major capsid protein